MDERISNFEQIASVRRYELTDGRGKGLEILDCDNGRLRFLLNVSKACDMMQLFDRLITLNLKTSKKTGPRAERGVPFWVFLKGVEISRSYRARSRRSHSLPCWSR